MSLFNIRRDTREGLVHNPFENPTIPLSSIGLDSVFGAISHSDSGESVTVDTAMCIPTVYRCVDLLSTVLAACPLRTYKDPGKQEKFPSLLDRGNSELLYTPYELMESIVMHIALWGNAYVHKVRAKELPKSDPRSAPRGSAGEDVIVDLKPINPSLVKPRLFNGDKIFEVTRVSPNGEIDNSHKPIIYTTFEVMHIPGMSMDGFIGLSPIEYARRTIGTSIAADKLASRFYANGSQLGGIIKVKAPLASQTQADEIRRRWMVKHTGVANSGDVAVLDAETDYQPVTIPPDQLQFLESRAWQTREVARIFGIPPHLVGDVEKSTSWGTGIEQQNVGFVAYTLKGWTKRIEQRFTREIINVRKQYCEFDLSELMRGAMSERYAAYAQGIQWGWITRNEVRIQENMPPIDGLDEPLTPMNMQTGNANDTLAPTTNTMSPTVPGAPKQPGEKPAKQGKTKATAAPKPVTVPGSAKNVKTP